jgi:uncharacterized protein YdhG (YjbR/CyaY superfamily)
LRFLEPKEKGVEVAGPTSVEDYLLQVPDDARAALERLRNIIRETAPDTIETISYQMPTFKYRGRALVGIAAFKNHCSVFPYSTGVMDSLREELNAYDTSAQGATIRFSLDKHLSAAVVKKIVRVRMHEIDARKK